MAEPMDEFEQELRRDLAARPAPEGLADAVMARLADRPPRRPWFRQPMWRWAAAGALAAVVAAGGGFQYQHQRQQKGERARAQVLLALRITAATLHDVEHNINQTNGPGKSGGRQNLQDQKED